MPGTSTVLRARPEPPSPTPRRAAQLTGFMLAGALVEQLRYEDGPRRTFRRDVEALRREAHHALDATIDEVIRQVDAGWFGARPMRVIRGGRR